MRKQHVGPWLLVLVIASGVARAGLQHRVWLLDPSVPAGAAAQLRGAGVDGFVVPVGSVEVVQGAARLTISPLPDLRGIEGMGAVPLVWVTGQGDAAGDAEAFLGQFAVVARSFREGSGVVLAARQFWPGLPRFAAALTKRLGAPVEIAMSASAIAPHLASEGWRGVAVTAVAFGSPQGLGFPPSTIHDDLQALDAIDDLDVPFRVALVVQPTVKPKAGPGGAALAELAKGTMAEYRPAQVGDSFVLRNPLDWGGVLLARGTSIEIDAVDTARYDRDLGFVLRPVRSRLLGWDTVGLPANAPTVGLSREALLDYLTGGMPRPAPEIVVDWAGPTLLRVAVDNNSHHASAAATSGNWIELSFPSGIVADVEQGEFRGLEYGQLTGTQFRRVGSGEASVLRFFVNLFAPMGQIGAAEVRFVQRPRELSGRWGARLSDGNDITGPVRPLPIAGRP
jgi:hypothetical protein